MEIFHYDFMQRALLAGLLIGLICPLVGIFVSLRRMSMIADALSHVCLSGVAAGLLAGINPVLSASAFAVAGALLLERLRDYYRNYSELAIAVMLSTGVALGAVLLSLGRGLNANFMSYLFGSIIAVSLSDIYIITAIGLVVLATVLLLYKELFLISFDEESARFSGVPVSLLSTIFTALTALTIAVAMRIVGILLVSSLMILPVAASLQIAASFKKAIWIAVLLSEGSVLVGLGLSYYLDLAPGGSIILTSVLFLITILLQKAVSRSFEKDAPQKLPAKG
jgi:ABC-type Mn2+/Zn2+ transport systems, permease components